MVSLLALAEYRSRNLTWMDPPTNQQGIFNNSLSKQCVQISRGRLINSPGGACEIFPFLGLERQADDLRQQYQQGQQQHQHRVFNWTKQLNHKGIFNYT